MLSARTTNVTTTQHYQEQPHIRTEIVILSPITDEANFRDDIKTRIDLVQKIMTAVNLNIEDVIRDQFGADIELIQSSAENLFPAQKETRANEHSPA